VIVVVGSINLDLVARVARLPRPGETLAGTAFATSPGGKGANQALAARRAGAAVALVGAVGDDAFAPLALAELRSAGVDLARVRSVSGATGTALIQVDDAGENTIVVVAGANAAVTADMLAGLALTPATTVVMQLEIPPATVRVVALKAAAAGARVVVNAAPAAPLEPALLDAVDVLIVNEHEAAIVAAHVGVAPAPAAFAAAMAARFGQAVIVTLGAGGALAAAAGTTLRFAAPHVEVVDSVGAGDALVGALAAALDRGAPLAEALKEGIAAGSLACTRRGAQAALPSRDDIARLAATI